MVQDIRYFTINRGMAFFYPTLHALDQAIPLTFPMDNDQELEALSNEFANMSYDRFRHFVGATDGLVLRVPKDKEVQYPLSYRNRKGCFAIDSDISNLII